MTGGEDDQGGKQDRNAASRDCDCLNCSDRELNSSRSSNDSLEPVFITDAKNQKIPFEKYVAYQSQRNCKFQIRGPKEPC